MKMLRVGGYHRASFLILNQRGLRKMPPNSIGIYQNSLALMEPTRSIIRKATRAEGQLPGQQPRMEESSPDLVSSLLG